ncbi:hypothetical protein GGQ73_003169 [Rhizobium skierniewicense]|uniref:Glycine-rich domain-containing protein n=1 Tax=Rhizobium skierniewicense TaxID=984260 RepID=A0A7W6CB95_9HYPH|nr:DUF2793 domain-containing protein [Rhizobium skierniewicense]MBB3947203.1 hypothetical protein [Rhizobium skierniewicense]
MDRINGADTIDIGGGKRGFRSENLVAGVSGTEVTDLFLNSVQEEIIRVVTEAGLVPDAADWSQLWQALRIHGLSAGAKSRRWTAINSMTLTATPAAPALGDTYLVPADATGAWAGNAGKIAEWIGAIWSYFTPSNGHGISLPDGRVFERIGGTYIEKLALDVQSGKWHYAEAGGTANALTASLTPTPSSIVPGFRATLKIQAINTDAMTLNLNGLGAVAVVGEDGAPIPPNSVYPGQLASFGWNGAKWVLMGFALSRIPPKNILTYSNPGTYTWTVPVGIYKVFARVWGGGGGGGGIAGTSNAGGGGGGGGYSEGWFDVVPGQVIIIVVAVRGAQGPASNSGFAGTGGTSSFGSFCSATGGVGGSNGSAAGGTGGTATGGSMNLSGGGGYSGGYIFGNTSLPYGGPGAPAYQQSIILPSFSGGAIAGFGFGSGGSGAASPTGSSAGAPGAPGCVIIQY